MSMDPAQSNVRFVYTTRAKYNTLSNKQDGTLYYLYDEKVVMLNGDQYGITSSELINKIDSEITSKVIDFKGVAGGFASLDGDGKVPLSQLPSITITLDDVEGLTTALSNIGIDITTLEGRVDQTETNISTLEGRVGQTETDISTLEGRVEQTETDISTLDSEITTLEGRVGQTETNITTLDNKIDSEITTLEGRVGQTETDINTLEGRVGQTETDINTLDSKIDSEIENLDLNTIDGTLMVSKGGTGTISFALDEVLIGNNANPIKTAPTINLDETQVIQDIENDISDLQTDLDSLTFEDIGEKIDIDTQVPPIPFDKLTITPANLTETINLDETQVIQDIETDLQEIKDNIDNIEVDLEDHTHNADDIVSGTLPVARGGTGKTNFTLDEVLVGDGTAPIKTVPTTPIQEWAMKSTLDPDDVPDLPINKITDLETRLQDIEGIAETNVQSDWTETDTTADSYIKNKPEEINIDNIPSIQNLTLNVSENKASINTHTNQINALNDELDTLEGDLSSLDTRVVSNTNDISTINSEIVGINNTLLTKSDVGHNHESSDITDAVNIGVVPLTTLSGNLPINRIIGLQTELDETIEDIKVNGTSLLKTDKSVDIIIPSPPTLDNIDGLLPVSKGGTGRDKLTQDYVLVGNNEDEVKLVEQINLSQIKLPQSQIIDLEEDLQALESDITNNTTDIADLTTRVGTNEDDIEDIQEELSNQINIDEVPIVKGMYEDNYFKGVQLDETYFKITFTRRDGTTAVIDLPLESVVVGGSYDTENKKIVLTLQNEETIAINVADLVTGLVSIPDLDKGEESNKTLGTTGTFKVLHISTSGTITEKTMTLNITANEVLGVNLVADKVLVGAGSNQVKLVDQTPISAWAMKSTLDPTDVPSLPISRVTNLQTQLDSKQDLIGYTPENTTNKKTSWSTTVNNTNYPSEKLVKDSLDSKVDKVAGKGLSTNDFTNTLKTKLDNIEPNAQVNKIESITLDSEVLPISSNKDVVIPTIPIYAWAMEATPPDIELSKTGTAGVITNITVDGTNKHKLNITQLSRSGIDSRTIFPTNWANVGSKPTTLTGYGITLTGDVSNADNAITISNSAIKTDKIDNNAITNAKILNSTITLTKLANIDRQTVLGNATSSTGAVTTIPLINIDELGLAKTTDLSAYATKTELTSGLAGKANSSHTHTIANITNLQNTLDGKADKTHQHTTADITALTGLPATASGSISTTDNLNTALRKLQTQINSKTSNTGTVTSVTLSGGTGISITNPTITTTGTITVALSNMNANTIKGRITSNGAPQNLTAAQVRTILNVADGAQKNVQSDWNATSGDAFIRNKPEEINLDDIVEVEPIQSTIVKRGTDGSASATSFKTGSAEIKYNSTTKSIDFIFN